MSNKYCNLYGINKINNDYTKINDGFAAIEKDIADILYTLNGVLVWEGIGSEPDENNIPTVTSYKRKDGTLFLKIQLTNRVDGKYQSCIVTNYGRDGITVVSESTSNIP